jgi:hypothetical protein
MTTKEILEMESAKESTAILLFREGIFLKAYETSAYLFHRFIKKYEVKVKYYKNIDSSLLSIGFPSRFLEVLVGEFGLECQPEEETPVCRLTSGGFYFSEEEYQAFRASQVSFSSVMSTKKTSSASLRRTDHPELNILVRLQQFDMAVSTPMECMLFLNELKSLLRG